MTTHLRSVLADRAGSAAGMAQTGNELGYAVGVAILGSIGTAVYRTGMADSDAPASAGDMLSAALAAARHLPRDVAEGLETAAREAFVHGLHTVAVVAAVGLAGVSVLTATRLRHLTPLANDTTGPASRGDTMPDLAPGAGFTVRRRLTGTAERVHAAFVEPDKLAYWFVVPGYHTPTERIRVSAQPGGRMDAVMISDTDGSEIPFGFEYTLVDPPHRVQLRFQEPAELVTVTLSDVDGGVDLTYEFMRWPALDNDDDARSGVDSMLDLIEDGLNRGVI
jgi:uncharacterized protein YndB with AHSA1/START domain